jgi:flagellar biosynthesis GTPase FlhF
MSQRPKKRLPKDVIAQYRNSGKEEAEIKAMISMFAEILCDNKNGNSSNTRTEEGGTMGQWSVDYYDDGDEKCIQFLRNVGGDDKGSKDDDEEDEEADADDMAEEVEDDQKQGTADKMAEQVTREEALAEEERARNAAKRREKKLRKKEKLKDEAALKAEQATAKKRSARIQSWRSRVIAASQSNEGYKMRNLLSESPLEDNVDAHLESLLPHCNSSQEEASQLLAAFIVNQSCKVVLIPGKNGRNALHTACLNTDSYFVKLVVQQQRGVELDSLCHDSGWTPLHYAVASGSLEIMELLLAAGANVKTCTDDSQTYRSR